MQCVSLMRARFLFFYTCNFSRIYHHQKIFILSNYFEQICFDIFFPSFASIVSHQWFQFYLFYTSLNFLNISRNYYTALLCIGLCPFAVLRWCHRLFLVLLQQTLCWNTNNETDIFCCLFVTCVLFCSRFT